MQTAVVNKIIPFSSVDGPGNRTAIFVQSCPFRCLYCHNPETIALCKQCGACVEVCPVGALTMEDGRVRFNRELCCDCDTCIKTCKHFATPKTQDMTTDEVMAEVKKVRPFIRGITVSGGECMNYPAFLKELFEKARQMDLGCLIDSNGHADFSQHRELLDLSDGVMLDVKATDPAFHEQLAFIQNDMVLQNFQYLLDVGKLAEVRTVLLPNHGEENRKTVEWVASRLGGKAPYKLIRYRPFGVRQEGLELFGESTLDEDEYQSCVELAETFGCEIIPV